MKKGMPIPNTSDLDDAQIEALIKKLSAIKGSAPELIAALEAEASSRASAAHRRGGGARRAQQEEEYEEEDDEDDDDEEESDDDEFDEEGPMVGDGYSDEVSVMSEMTTPTVVSNIYVPEEERYQEIQTGGKRRDLLAQVNRANTNAARKQAVVGGINPEKRKTYTSAMAKISETEVAAPAPAVVASSAKPKKKVVKKRVVKPDGDGTKKAAAPSTTTKGTVKKLAKPPTPTGKTGKKVMVNKSIDKPKTTSKTTTTTNAAKNTTTTTNNDSFSAFPSDNWHQSLTDFNSGNMGDDGFPMTFENNAFAASANGFFNTSATGGSGDAFDPFNNKFDEDPFSAFTTPPTGAKATIKKHPSTPSSAGRRRGTSAAVTKSKRDTSPKPRKGVSR